MTKRRSLHRTGLALFSAIAAFALPAFAKVSPDEFTAACAAGDKAKVEKLLAAGAKAGEPDAKGRLPLLCAIFSRKAEIVELLLHRGADPNAEGICPEKDCGGHPSLPLAAYLGDAPIVKLLLVANADLAWHDHYAARDANVSGRVEILRLLRAAGGSEKGAATAAQPKKSGPPDAQPAPSGLSRLLPARPAVTRKAGAKLRVAIVAGDELRAAADLLAASLAGAPFELVERGELQRVLDEPKLTAQLGADGARAADIGALLGADALVLLRKVRLGETDSLELRFVRVSPGIVLDSAYRAWPLADAPAWAADAAARITQLDPKLRDDHAIAIATAPFRPLTDTPAAASLARECLLLLNDRLAHQPGLVLLERESVDLVAREQGIGKAGAFWAGSYLLDGTAEPSANDAALAALTLRLAPIGAGEAKIFKANGPRAELPRLAGELVAQAATALKLRAAPPSDLKPEAQRYFDESRNLFAIGLPLPAYRAAATAAAFGLDSEDFIEWRLETALKLLAWQVGKLSEISRFKELRWNGWSEAWIENRMAGAEWMRPAEWTDLGEETIRLWRRLLLPALRSDDAERAAALLARHESVIGGAFAVFHSMDLAATALDFHDAHLAIPQAVRETLEEALALADAKPAHAANAGTIAVQIAKLAGALYRDKASLVTAFTPLLSRDFATENAATRVLIRHALFSLDAATYSNFTAPKSERVGQITLLSADLPTPHAPAARAALREAVPRGASVEDELTRAAFDYFESQSAERQRASSEKLFDLFWQRRQFFVDVPPTVRLMLQICARVSQSGGDAPKFAARAGGPEGPPAVTPEMRKLRRDLFILIAKNAVHPGPAMDLLSGDFQPAGEDTPEIAALHQRVVADYIAPLRDTGSRSAAPTPAQKPRPILPATPTYAKYPPLKVVRRWTAAHTPHGPTGNLVISAPAFEAGANALWLFGESEVSLDEKSVRSCVFEVSLPSLKTTAWALPEFQRVHLGDGSIVSGTVHLFPQRDFVYVARDEEFLAIGNRGTRKWKLLREVQPSGDFARVGGELFFLTRGGGARGMSSISLRDQSIAVLASNRRTPPQTPLDRADLAAISLKAGATGVLEFVTEPFDPANSAPEMDSESKPQSLLIYDPAKRSWTGPKLIEESETHANDFTPLIAAGVPKAYKEEPESNVWTLQLPRPEMPKVRLRIDFGDANARASANPVVAFMFGSWYWVPHGYFYIESSPFTDSLVYFLPQSELDAYLDGHKPDEDESSSAPPAPGKKAKP